MLEMMTISLDEQQYSEWYDDTIAISPLLLESPVSVRRTTPHQKPKQCTCTHYLPLFLFFGIYHSQPAYRRYGKIHPYIQLAFYATRALFRAERI
jgi:hypothetical protein